MNALSLAVARHLKADAWSFSECHRCSTNFLASPARRHCGRPACRGNAPRPRKPERAPRFPEQLWHLARGHFNDAGFATTNRCDLANPSTRGTRFVGAGLQVFEETIEFGAPPPPRPLFVPQPVIRLNYIGVVGGIPGTSTSFLNLCTEHARSSLPAFLHHLDIWLNLLRKLKVRTRDITIILSADRWRGGPFAGPSVVIEVAGIEVGDAILIDEGTGGNAANLLPIADFSFGLERLAWVVNSGWPYYAFIGPLPETSSPDNERVLDRIRTSTLMCLAGVNPSSRGHGRHFRQLLTDGMMQHATIDLTAAISHAFRYWSHFINPLRGLLDCRRILESEWTRARTIEVVRQIYPKGRVALANHAESTDEACRRLLVAGASFQTLVEFANRISCRSFGTTQELAVNAADLLAQGEPT